jgi:hypothetical protein
MSAVWPLLFLFLLAGGGGALGGTLGYLLGIDLAAYCFPPRPNQQEPGIMAFTIASLSALAGGALGVTAGVLTWAHQRLKE